MQEKLSYGYDAASNLSKRTNNLLVQTFNVNTLNQLSTATRSGTLTVAGAATTPATSVTVNGLTASLYQDKSFAKDGFTAATGNNTFTAITADGTGRTATNILTVNLLADPVSFTYDLNGNLTSDGRRTFDYDDADQLIRVTVANSWKTEFTYDGLQRLRFRKEFTWNGSSWVQNSNTYHIYDGRRVIQERNSGNSLLVSYTRGLDLSGSLEGAGGIGGLFMRTDHLSSAPYAYYHADGNGNVTALMTGAQTLAAKYLYDPFGHTLAKNGPLADANVYQFSSKEFHASSGLYYYGFRFYEPNLQRWLNRDPIGEQGGINLYAFVTNDPVDFLDPLGLAGFGELRMAEAHMGEVNQSALDGMLQSAIRRVRSHEWDFTSKYTNFGHVFGRVNKCNLFVWAMAQENDAFVMTNFFKGRYPPLAAHIGDSNTPIPGWIITNRPIPGAIMSDGFHVGIVVGSNSTISATGMGVVSNNWGFRPNSGPMVIRVPIR